jgi:hypothetical protein
MREEKARICETSDQDPRDALQNREEDPNNMNDGLTELIEELRKEANNTDRDLVGNTEYRVKHEVANRLSDLKNNE